MDQFVSVVIPARNESAHISGCVRSVLEQRFDGHLEVIVADGDSTDGTAEAAVAAGARVVANPRGTIPAGLNAAVAAASGNVIVRFDAHAEMPPGYISACLRALTEEEPNAVNVGGWREARGTGPWGQAVGAALASRLGVGNRRIWRRPPASARRMRVDSVPLGCWRASVLEAIGGWDEAFACNEDFELNNRLRRNGGKVIFDPAIWSIYFPRESLDALAHQYWRYGGCKALMLRSDPMSIRPRQLAPLALAAALIASLSGARVGQAGRATLAIYALAITTAAATSRGGWRTAPVLTTMHVTWAGGLLLGVFRCSARPVGAAGDDV